MINKLGPLVVLAGAAQSYFSKTKEGKRLAKEAAKKRMKKGRKDDTNTGDGKSAAHGKYRGK